MEMKKLLTGMLMLAPIAGNAWDHVKNSGVPTPVDPYVYRPTSFEQQQVNDIMGTPNKADEDVFDKTIQIGGDEALFEFVRDSIGVVPRDKVKLLCPVNRKDALIFVNINIEQGVADIHAPGLRQIVIGAVPGADELYITGKGTNDLPQNPGQGRTRLESLGRGFQIKAFIYNGRGGHQEITPLKFFAFDTYTLNILEYVLFQVGGNTDAYKEALGDLTQYGDLLALYGKLHALDEVWGHINQYEEQDFQRSKFLRLLKGSRMSGDLPELNRLLEDILRELLDNHTVGGSCIILNHARELGKQDLNRCIRGFVIESLPSFEIPGNNF